MPDGGGGRKNEGKRKYSYEPVIPRIYSTENLMVGAKKYDPFNWARGMSWSDVIECLERHLMKIKAGIDIDPEDGLPHASKIISNAQFLLEFLHTYPKGDDRRHHWLDLPKIALDIDEVIADWVLAWMRRHNLPSRPRHWSFGYDTLRLLEEAKDDREFWMGITPLTPPGELPFEPVAYVTARVCSEQVTMDWLEHWGFPTKRVINVGLCGNKVEAVKSTGCDIYVDDNFETFVEVNKAGIPCFLFDRPHNEKFDVGARRIKDLATLVKRPT